MTENPPGVLPGIDQTELLNLFATVGVGPNQSSVQSSQIKRAEECLSPNCAGKILT
jgi:hypothetical protein